MRIPVKILIVVTAISLGTMHVKAQQQSQSATLQMTLKECIAYGLGHHRSITIYQNNIEAANQQARQALSAYLPQVAVNAELDDNLKLQESVIPANTFPGQTQPEHISLVTKYASTQSVQLDQKIFDQSLLTGLQANKEYKELAVVNADQNNENLIYNISSAYYQILVNQKQLELLYNNKDQFEKILRVTELQAAQGVSKKVDVKQVQVNLNNVLAQISVTENNLTLAKNTLKNNIGLSQNADIAITDTARWLGNAPTNKMYDAFDYKNTLLYQQQRLQVDLDDINRKSIKNQMYPTLSLFGRYGASGFGANSIGDAYNPLLDYSTVGLKLSWKIFTGFSRDAQYKQAVITWNNDKETLALNEASQELQYQNANVAVTRAQSTISTNKSNMELATEVYTNSTLQYKQGVATLSDLLNAEQSYREAQNNYITSLLDYYLADLDVQKANGTLKEYYNKL